MRSSRMIIATIVCLAVICGLLFSWHAIKTRANDRKLIEDAKASRVQADQGRARAEADLASMYYRGKGVPQSYTEALLWYRKAADQGDARAQQCLASMYYHGEGTPQDYSLAVSWSRKAADQGDPNAQYSIGSMYYNGLGVRQDYTEALSWYRKAANGGHAKAQYGLGYMYYYGQGVSQDRSEADRWFHKAADQGDEDARHVLGIKKTGVNTWKIIALLLTFLGSSLILISSVSPGRSLQNKRVTILTGLVGMFWVGLSLFALYCVDMIKAVSAENEFCFAKNVLAGLFVIMVLSILSPKSAVPKNARVALGVIGVSFVGFNLYGTAHYDLVSFPSAIHLFCLVNGLLVGMLIPIAIFLWAAGGPGPISNK